MGNDSIIMGSGLRAQGSGLRAQGIFWLGMGGMSMLAFVILYCFTGRPSFWLDELFQVGYINNSLTLKETLEIYLKQDAVPPLFALLAYFWYRIVPHTEEALRSLSILLCLFSCILTGLTGKKLLGVRFGFSAFFFMLVNHVILRSAAYEFRQYGLLLFVVSLNMYFYVCRLYDESWLNITLYGLTMCLIPYTHYLSVLICFAFFIVDCLLIKKERAKLRVWTSYFIGAALFLPWAYFFLKYHEVSVLQFWATVPTFFSTVQLELWLLSDDMLLWIFLVGMLYLGKMLYNTKVIRKEPLATDIFFLTTGAWAVVFMIMVLYVYSAFINPKGSCFVNRYFLSLTPFLSWIMAYGLENVCSRLLVASGGEKRHVGGIFGLLFLQLFIVAYVQIAQTGSAQPWREVAELIHHFEASRPSNAVILSTGDRFSPMSYFVFTGWEEMYLTKDHSKTAPPILLMMPQTLRVLQSKRYERIYLCYLHTSLPRSSSFFRWLQENYVFSGPINNYSFQVLVAK